MDLTTVIVLWLLAGTITNIYFIRKTMLKRGIPWNKLDSDDKSGLISGIIFSLFLPPAFWAIILGTNLVKRRKFSFSIS